MTEQRRMPLPDGWSWAKSAAIHPHASFEAVHKHGGFVHILTGARAQFAGSEHATLAVLVDRIGPLEVLRAIAETFPEHVAVVADEVMQRTTPREVAAWRHSDDVAAIEQAWIESAFWRDQVAVRRVLRRRISDDQADALVAAATAQEAADTGGETPIADAFVP